MGYGVHTEYCTLYIQGQELILSLHLRQLVFNNGDRLWSVVQSTSVTISHSQFRYTIASLSSTSCGL